jgi:hypothetical protein
MPIEVRELVIRAVVEQTARAPSETPQPAARDADEREALVQACVEQVLRILRREQER